MLIAGSSFISIIHEARESFYHYMIKACKHYCIVSCYLFWGGGGNIYGAMDGPRGTVHSAADGPGGPSEVAMDGSGGPIIGGDHWLWDTAPIRFIHKIFSHKHNVVKKYEEGEVS